MAADNSLARRLERIKKARKHSGGGNPGGDGNIPRCSCTSVPGWRRISEFLFKRDTVSEFRLVPDENGDFSFFHPDSGPLRPEDLLFYDLETTGLSSGAGVVAFLAGFGRIEEGRIIVSQYFMSDFPGERELVDHIAEEIRRKKVLVSYNGKTFDRHLLVTRFRMNGLSFPDIAELDLLHVSRRLWKDHIPSCTLASVEENILGIERTNDISGRYIPDLYFSFLKSGNPELLSGVFSHHLQDIVSLSSLLGRISDLWKNPGNCSGGECYSLGKYMLLRGNPEGEKLLVKIWSENGEFSYMAGKFLGYFYKRSGRIDDAVNIWLSMWKNRPGYVPGIELAKYFEHKLRNYSGALEVTEKLAEMFPSRRKDLYHRKNRLLRKIAGSTRR